MSRAVVDRRGLLRRIQALYAQAESRADVGNVELQHHNETFRTPFMSGGLQVHLPYTAYAHWLVLRRMLAGGGVRQLQAGMGIDSMNRATFLCAFAEEVKWGAAHAFFVRYDKFKTVDERRRILEESKPRRRAFARSLPPDVRKDRGAVARLMMKANLSDSQPHGRWRDERFEHPLPTMNEPHKAMCWLTPHASVDEDRKADMLLNAGLARVDNVFQMIMRQFNALSARSEPQAATTPLGTATRPTTRPWCRST